MNLKPFGLLRLRKTEVKQKEPEEKEMTEAEIAMMEAKKRHEAEEEAKARDSDERRRQELAAVEQELIELKVCLPLLIISLDSNIPGTTSTT